MIMAVDVFVTLVAVNVKWIDKANTKVLHGKIMAAAIALVAVVGVVTVVNKNVTMTLKTNIRGAGNETHYSCSKTWRPYWIDVLLCQADPLCVIAAILV